MSLEDIEEIKRLKALYCAYCDDNFNYGSVKKRFT